MYVLYVSRLKTNENKQTHSHAQKRENTHTKKNGPGLRTTIKRHPSPEPALLSALKIVENFWGYSRIMQAFNSEFMIYTHTYLYMGVCIYVCLGFLQNFTIMPWMRPRATSTSRPEEKQQQEKSYDPLFNSDSLCMRVNIIYDIKLSYNQLAQFIRR